MLAKAKLFMEMNRDKIALILNVVLIITGIVGIVVLYRKEITKKLVEITYVGEEEIYGQNTEEQKVSYIDISGQVVNPGVYKIERGDILSDIILESGGFTKEVNQEYLHKCLNLSQRLNNEQKIYIPANNENLSCGNSMIQNDASMTSSLISINNATTSELEEIPGVGPATAANIINARPFSSIEDLQKVSGIGPKTFEKLKPFVEL